MRLPWSFVCLDVCFGVLLLVLFQHGIGNVAFSIQRSRCRRRRRLWINSQHVDFVRGCEVTLVAPASRSSGLL